MGAHQAAVLPVNPDEPQVDRVLKIHGYDVYPHANTYFRIGRGEVVKAVAPGAEAAGVEFFYSCPARQLVTDESGRVTGVVCEEDGKNVLFTASKGVILATGDYQCDPEMIAYYCPDVKEFPPCQMNRTGDGHKMGVWAGGEIEPITHTKMIHDARVGRVDTPPFMVVPHEFGYGLSAIIGGLLINADNQVLKADEHTPIEGLFAVGNVSGCFYGGADYPMDVLGLSIGRAITGGFLAGKHVAAL